MERKEIILYDFIFVAYDLFKCGNYDLWTSVFLRLCIVS